MDGLVEGRKEQGGKAAEKKRHRKINETLPGKTAWTLSTEGCWAPVKSGRNVTRFSLRNNLAMVWGCAASSNWIRVIPDATILSVWEFMTEGLCFPLDHIYSVEETEKVFERNVLYLARSTTFGRFRTYINSLIDYQRYTTINKNATSINEVIYSKKKNPVPSSRFEEQILLICMKNRQPF